MGQWISYLPSASESSESTTARQTKKTPMPPLFRELNEPYRKQWLHLQQPPRNDMAEKGLLRAEASHWVYLNTDAFDAIKQFTQQQKAQARTYIEQLKSQLDITDWDQDNVETVNTLLDDLHISLIGGVLDKLGKEKATQFDLSNCYLTRFPQQLFSDQKYLETWKSFTEFKLSHNNITYLEMPDFLEQLTTIDVSYNLLSNIKLPSQLVTSDEHSNKNIILNNNRLQTLELPESTDEWGLELSDNLFSEFIYPNNPPLKIVDLDLDNNQLWLLDLQSSAWPIVATAFGNLLTEETLTYNPNCPAVAACPFNTNGLGWVDYTLLLQKEMQQLAFEVAHFQSPPDWLLERLGQEATKEYLERIKPLANFNPEQAPSNDTRVKLNQTLDGINNFLADKLAEYDNCCNLNNCYLTRLTNTIGYSIKKALDKGFAINNVVLANNFFFELELGIEFTKATKFDAAYCPNLKSLSFSEHCANLDTIKAAHCDALTEVTFEGIDTPKQAQPAFIDLSQNPSLSALRFPIFFKQINVLILEGSQLNYLTIHDTTEIDPNALNLKGCNLYPSGLQLPASVSQAAIDDILQSQAPFTEFVRLVSYYRDNKEAILSTYEKLMTADQFKAFSDRVTSLSEYSTDTTTVPVNFTLDLRMVNTAIVVAKSNANDSVLDLKNSYLTSLTYVSGVGNQVKTLYLDGNPLPKLDYQYTEFGNVESITLKDMPNLNYVNFQGYGVPHLSALVISNTLLASFPMPPGLQQLAYLDLRNNQLPTIYISGAQKLLTQNTVLLDGNQIAAEDNTVLPKAQFEEAWIKQMLDNQRKPQAQAQLEDARAPRSAILPGYSKHLDEMEALNMEMIQMSMDNPARPKPGRRP